MDVVIVYNPKSGTSISRQEIIKICNINKIKIIEMIAIDDNIKKKLSLHIKTKRTIIVIGGDGTISSVANILAGSDSILAPIPGGTLNHFTKDLGIPQDINKAFSRLKNAKCRNIDVGIVNNIVFVNNSSFGIYPKSLRVRKDLEASIGKWPAAFFGVVTALIHFQIYKVAVDDRILRTPFVFVGNNDYRFDKRGAINRSHLDSGKLGVAIVRSSSRLHTIWLSTRVITGRAQNLKEFETLLTEDLKINSKHRYLHVSHDGEVSKISTPLRFQIKKGALRVM